MTETQKIWRIGIIGFSLILMFVLSFWMESYIAKKDILDTALLTLLVMWKYAKYLLLLTALGIFAIIVISKRNEKIKTTRQ